MEKNLYDSYISILKSELIEALGCTEPIAIAYAAAKAKLILDKEPKHMEVGCSGNIIKNVKGVKVPNTGGLVGIEAAAIAGVVGGNPEKGLRVLEDIKPAQYDEIKKLLAEHFCAVRHLKDVENLYVIVKVYHDDEYAEIHIKDFHTNIVKAVKNGVVLPLAANEGAAGGNPNIDKGLLTVKGIVEFADTVELADLEEMLENQIARNTAISQEGLKHNYGMEIGRTLLQSYGDDIKIRAKATAAAGSDARMGGCPMPVVINSGSGNQGITVSMPVVEYAKELHVSKEKLYRALIISNLIGIYQKYYIGNLSAYCGAVCAAAGSGAGITYLYGGTVEEISRTIINTIANVGGILCDGAKPSCAAKIASAVDAAILGHQLSIQGKVFENGQGLVKEGVEGTIKSLGQVGNNGLRVVDTEIIDIMISSS